MAQNPNTFGFQTNASSSGGGGTNTNIANTNLTQDANRTLDGGGNTLEFTNQTSVTLNSGLFIKNGANAPNIRIFENSGSGTNYALITLGNLNANRTITIPNATGTIALLEARQTFTDRNVIRIREFIISSSTDGDAIGDIVYLGTTSVTAGKCYVYNSSGGWDLADRRTEADAIGFLAVACGTGQSNAVGMCIRGMVTMATDVGSVGDVLWLRITGDFENAIPTNSGEYVRVMGYCLDDTNGQIYFNPSQDWTEIA